MGLQQGRRDPLPFLRYENLSFAEALVLDAVVRHVRGAALHPRGRAFPKTPLHPSAIAVFPGDPPRRVLIDSARRLEQGIKMKRGFSRLESFYRTLVQGFLRAHKDQPLELEFWSFEPPPAGRPDLADKLARRLPVPVRFLGPAVIGEQLRRLKPELSDADDLRAVLGLVSALQARKPKPSSPKGPAKAQGEAATASAQKARSR